MTGFCPNCHAELPEGATFCPVCGNAVSTPIPTGSPRGALDASQQVICPRCGQSYIPPGPNFCESCGYPLAKAAGPGQSAADGLAAASSIQSAEITSPTGQAAGWAPYQPPQVAPDQGETAPGKGTAAGEGVPPVKPPKTGKIPKFQPGGARRWIWILGGVVLLAAIVFIVFKLLPDGSKNSTPATPPIEACKPARVTDEFEEANRQDLDGSLRQDSYFNSGQDYTITADGTFTIPKGKTLIMKPGARVKFGEGAKMVVEGKLLACGTGGKRIMFTADAAAGEPGFWAGVEIKDADPETVIGHATFEYAGKDSHAPLWVEASDVHLEDLKFDANAWYPISLDPNSFPQLRRPLEVENGLQGWEIRAGEMTTAQTWDSQQPFIVREVLTIGEQGSLALEPGTAVKFLPGGAINIHGNMQAVGDSKQPIRFTSYNDDDEEGSQEPQSGDWVGLRFYGREGRSRLENVAIAYGGRDGDRVVGCLWMEDAEPVLVNVSIEDCAGFAISTDIVSTPTLEKLNLSETDPLRRWELRGSQLEENLTRTLARLETIDGQPLLPVVTGWVGAIGKASLAIDPGVTILFAHGDIGLWADGDLQVGAEGKEPVLFTSVRDPVYSKEGGAAPGDWAGLHLKSGQSNDKQIRNLEMRFGGNNNKPCLRVEAAAPFLENVIVRQCATAPVSSDASSQPQVKNLDIQDNDQANVWDIWESTLAEPKVYEWATFEGKDGSQIIRRITGVITVNPEASLKIPAGVIVKFTGGKGIQVKGNLNVAGTNEQPVVFTSWRDPTGGGKDSGAQPGDWGGIVFDKNIESSLSYLEVRYAGIEGYGVGCLNFTKSKTTLKDVKIDHCNYFPLTSDLASQLVIENLSLADNQPADEWAIRESQLQKGDQLNWGPISDNGVTVLRTVTGWLTVEEGANLSISEGVVIKFSNGVGLRVRGGLTADGSRNNPILMTSWRDPAYSRESGAQPGDWPGLFLEGPKAAVSLTGVQIHYAGGDQNPRGALVLSNTSPVLENVSIQDSAWYPISLDAVSNPNIQDVRLTSNSPANAVEIRTDRLEASGEYVWNPWEDTDGQPLPRVVTGMLAVGPQATLHLAPGLVLKFVEGAGLDISGSLIADRAVLTSLHDNEYGGPAVGNPGGQALWQGVTLRGHNLVQINQTLIRFAQVGVNLVDSAPTISDVRIEDCWEAALGSDLLSIPQVTGLDLQRNAINGVLLMADSLPEGTTSWGVIGDPETQTTRVVRSMLGVGPNSRLIIEPGVIVKFSAQAGLMIEGGLTVGSADGSIAYLTSLADDALGGDADNSAQAPIRGSWQGLRLNPNNTQASVSLNSMEILFAATALEVLNPLTWQIGGLTVANSQLYGISCATPYELPFSEAEITLTNNGQDIYGCTFPSTATPTPELLTPTPEMTPTP